MDGETSAETMKREPPIAGKQDILIAPFVCFCATA